MSSTLHVRSPGEMATEAGTDAFVAVPIAVLLEWQEQLHNAFELGVKSAGGSIVPDRSKFVEVALDRTTINALALAAEFVIGDGARPYVADEALKHFLETISIHRSRK